MLRLWPSATDLGREAAGTDSITLGTVLRTGILAVLFVGACGPASWTSVLPAARVDARRAPQEEPERRLRRIPAHISEFNPVNAPLAIAQCARVRQPEALLTPDPLLSSGGEDHVVRISFIVGTDGHVHSAFVLSGGGPDEDALVLSAVRRWRYRPALCNGVPTDAEARVRFSIP